MRKEKYARLNHHIYVVIDLVLGSIMIIVIIFTQIPRYNAEARGVFLIT